MVLSLTKQGKEKMFYVVCMGFEAVFNPAEIGVVRTGFENRKKRLKLARFEVMC